MQFEEQTQEVHDLAGYGIDVVPFDKSYECKTGYSWTEWSVDSIRPSGVSSA